MNINPRLETERQPPLWLQLSAAVVFGALWLALVWGFVFGDLAIT